MKLSKSQNFPTHLNGEEIIKVVSGRKHEGLASFKGMIDLDTKLYNNDSTRYHLGMLSAWGMQGRESYPMISKLLETGKELLVKGFFGEFTYDKPFYDPKKGLRTVSSTVDEAGDYPGIDESEFDIILSEPCYAGDILSTDMYGEADQLIVTRDSEPTLNGAGNRVTVTLTSGLAEKFYNKSLLDTDIDYYKINHVGTEYTTSFTGVDSEIMGAPTGYYRARFKLGGIRGVEGYVTGFADAIKSGFSAVNENDKSAQMAVEAMQRKYADGDPSANTVIFGKKDKNGNADLKTMRASALMPFLVEKTLMKRTATSHIWQKQGQIKTANGVVYLNEGVWHQLRRGKRITIPKFMGITKAHIAEAVEYVYRNNPDLPWEDREIVFEGGKHGETNLLLIFQDEIQRNIQNMQQTGMLALLFGQDGLLSEMQKKQFLSGNLDDLAIKTLIKFTSVQLIGIAGKVTIKHNPALDRLSGNNILHKGQLPGGLDWTSHSLIIWDATDQQYSNNEKNIKGATFVHEGDTIKGNLYLARPEEGMTYKGHENGRWDRGKNEDIISSSRVIGQGFWAFNSSSMWVPYPDRAVIIELSAGARRQGGVPYNY